MKKLFLICLVFSCLNVVNAAKIRLNNQLIASGSLYATWPDAYNNANSGDTIYVEGSPYSYGTMSISKSLTVIGPGYLLGSNPKTLSSGLNAHFTTVDINSGSVSVTLMGLTMYRVHINSPTTFGLGYVNIIRNYIYYQDNDGYPHACVGFVNGVGNVSIIQNILTVQDNKAALSATSGSSNWEVTNLIFQNNIVNKNASTSNCVFLSGNPNLYSSVLANNTIKLSTFESVPGTGNILRDNIIELSGATGAPTATLLQNNYTNKTTWSNCFNCGTSINFTTGFYTATSTTEDGKFQVVSTAAKSASTTSGEIGAFGGASPYILSGQTTVPSIYELTVPAVVNSVGGMNVILKTKTNP